jgi:hypothetical protein
MYIFIDESGIHKDAGLFSVALVYVEKKNIELFNKVILQAEAELHIHDFHWSKRDWGSREKYAAAILYAPFFVKIAILPNPFSNTMLYEDVFKHLLAKKDRISVVIDGKKSTAYEKQLKKAFKSIGISGVALSTGNDRGHSGLRIADLFAGMCRYYFENPHNKHISKLYKMLKKKIRVVLEK